jgi:hypoxanthine-DNA glycosylase
LDAIGDACAIQGPTETEEYMGEICGLPPVEGARALVLILGTMPGAESLRRGEYYAQARNAFWKVMAQLGVDQNAAYEERCRQLGRLGIALWDVVGSCERIGSLDSAIKNPKLNDIGSLVARHPELRLVVLNGQKAEKLFSPIAKTLPQSVKVKRLPSTSAANARSGKVDEWQRALRSMLGKGC